MTPRPPHIEVGDRLAADPPLIGLRLVGRAPSNGIADRAHGVWVQLRLAGTLVETLFRCGGPSAIVWFIVAVVVNAVKGLAFWALAHIFEEIGEALPPPSANRDSATSVERPVRRL